MINEEFIIELFKKYYHLLLSAKELSSALTNAANDLDPLIKEIGNLNIQPEAIRPLLNAKETQAIVRSHAEAIQKHMELVFEDGQRLMGNPDEEEQKAFNDMFGDIFD